MIVGVCEGKRVTGTLGRTATIGVTIVVTIMVGRTGGGDGRRPTANNVVAVGVGQSGALDALRLA